MLIHSDSRAAGEARADVYEQDAKDRISLYLENCQYVLETENIGEEISGLYSAQDNASAIIRYFRRCGWLSEREIGRSGDNIAAVNIYCRQLVGAIEKIFQRDAELETLRRLIARYDNATPALTAECARLKALLAKRAVPKDLPRLEDIFKALLFVERNRRRLYLREASMLIYGGSKYFEENLPR